MASLGPHWAYYIGTTGAKLVRLVRLVRHPKDLSLLIEYDR